jgi:hypothetical protein
MLNDKTQITIEQVQEKLNAELDLGLSLSKALGSLRHLARESNSPEWKGSITQGVAILDALNAVQLAVKSRQKIIDIDQQKG